MSLKNIKVGDSIKFKGYAEDVPEADRLLEADATYAVTEVDLKEKQVFVDIDNPDYNPKKKVSDENAKTLSVGCFEDEFDMAEATPPASARTARAAAAKPAAAAAKPAKAVKPPKEETVDELDIPLEEEDAEILKLVQETDDILALATELVEESAATDYKLGGVLYHVRLDKAYEKLSKKYKEAGGFELYLQERLNIEYRKAMALVQIYHAVNKYGVDSAKITEMGWTKAWKIAQVMDEKNSKALVKLASTSTVADLVENIKVNYKEVGGTKGEKKKLVTFKFRLFEDSAEVVTAAIEGCAASQGFKRLDEAFEHIITEWATEHPMQAPGKQAAGRKVTAPTAAAAPAKTAAKPAVRSARR